MKMLDRIAARLQPLMVVLFIGAVLCMLLFAVSASPAFPLSPLVPLYAMTSFGGLLGVAYWFAPGRGPLSPEVLQHKRGIMGLSERILRFIAPGFLFVWFLWPLPVFVSMLVQK